MRIAEIKNGIDQETKRTDGQYDAAARLYDGDLLFCWSGQPETSIGTFQWWGGDAWLNQHIFKVSPTPEISASYLRALLRYLQPSFVQIARNKQTTGLGHVTKADLREMLVRIPGGAEQAQISAVLDLLEEKIELNRRTSQTLEGIARAVFKSWFVDFDPVRAKMEGRPTGLSDDLSALLPDAFGENGLPIGWTSNVDAIAQLSRSMVSPEEVDPATLYIGLEHLPRQNLVVAQWGNGFIPLTQVRHSPRLGAWIRTHSPAS